MKDFNFEYTDIKYMLKLTGITFIILIILMYSSIFMADYIGRTACIILIFGVPILIFFLNKKNIKKVGSASIYDNYSDFIIDGTAIKINYGEINYYKVEYYNGALLKIMLIHNKSIRIQANTYFCKPEKFEKLCHEFDNTIKQYRKTNNTELQRKKSLLEQSWIIYLIILMSLVTTGLIVLGFYQGKNLKPALIIAAGATASLWVGYLKVRKNK